MNDVALFLPETVCLLGALALFVAQACGARYGALRALALTAGAAALAAAAWTGPLQGEPFAPGIYRVDLFSQLTKAVLAAGFLFVVAVSGRPATVREEAWPELPWLLLLATVGLMMLASAMELVTLYIAIELAAYPVYVAVALHRRRAATAEGATKYMLQGMVASAVTLYGLSLLFGLLGDTHLDTLAARLPVLAPQPLFWVALLLVLAGFLFKLAAFPFHFWAADTYQTAPHEVVTFLATASKVGAVAVLVRVVALVAPAAECASGLSPVLMWASVAAMALGNLGALRQRDLKRLLGYSAVAHAGYLLVGVQALSALGLTAALFYAVAYAAMTGLVLLVVCAVGRDLDTVPVAALAGLHRRSPGLALVLLVGLLGLIGLPPTAGFLGKWFLFSAAAERGQLGLVLVAAVNAVAATYYYLMVLRQAWLAAPEGNDEVLLAPGGLTWAAAAAATTLVLAMGVAPGWFWARAAQAVAALQPTR